MYAVKQSKSCYDDEIETSGFAVYRYVLCSLHDEATCHFCENQQPARIPVVVAYIPVHRSM